tara:strand:- start:180 stop:1190 length:1011 start_codon:yes stop_codon:yes gene_type:complete
MSTMLEQAVIDATALREVALKNAEATVIEQYSDKIKEAVETLLEQDLDLEEETELDLDQGSEEEEVVSSAPMAAHAGEKLCLCPEEEGEGAVVTLNLDDLIKQVKEKEPAGDALQSSEEAAEELIPSAGPLEEEIDLDQSELEDLLEKLTVDIHPEKTGWAGTPKAILDHAAEELLALEEDTAVKEENETLRKAVENLESVNESISSELNDYKKAASKLTEAVKILQEKIEELSISNAKLLFTNKALTNVSLNERQKSKIAESLAMAETVEETKVIYETLQSAVGSTSKKPPMKSLSEAVNRTSSTMFLSRRKEQKKRKDPALDRWKMLAGINKED